MCQSNQIGLVRVCQPWTLCESERERARQTDSFPWLRCSFQACIPFLTVNTISKFKRQRSLQGVWLTQKYICSAAPKKWDFPSPEKLEKSSHESVQKQNVLCGECTLHFNTGGRAQVSTFHCFPSFAFSPITNPENVWRLSGVQFVSEAA